MNETMELVLLKFNKSENSRHIKILEMFVSFFLCVALSLVLQFCSTKLNQFSSCKKLPLKPHKNSSFDVQTSRFSYTFELWLLTEWDYIPVYFLSVLWGICFTCHCYGTQSVPALFNWKLNWWSYYRIGLARNLNWSEYIPEWLIANTESN